MSCRCDADDVVNLKDSCQLITFCASKRDNREGESLIAEVESLAKV